MIDAVDPANIGTEYNGRLAMKGTVHANPAGQFFDISDIGNATAAQAAQAMGIRWRAGRWSIAYINQSGEAPTVATIRAFSLPLLDAPAWPNPGIYLWCADPSGNISAGRWKPAVTPLAVQTVYAGTHDLSTVAPNFPVAVAGYMDGIYGQAPYWTAAAWARFATIPDTPPTEGGDMADNIAIGNDPDGNLIVLAKAGDPANAGHLLYWEKNKTSGAWSVVDVTDAVKGANPADPRTYIIA